MFSCRHRRRGGQAGSNSSSLSDSILFFPLPFLAVTATAELMAAGFGVDGFAAGLLSSLAIIFSNNSNPDDLMVGSPMSLRISFSLKTYRARMSAEAAMVDQEVSTGEIKEPLAAANDGNRFPSGLIQIQLIFLLMPVPSLIAFQPGGSLW